MVNLAQHIKPAQVESNSLTPDEAFEVQKLAEDPKIRAAVLLRAFSIPMAIVEEVLDVAHDKVNQALLCPSLQDIYSKWSVKIKEYAGDDAFERLLPLAVFTHERALHEDSVDLKTKLMTADKVIDRVRGKPRQSLDVRSVNLNVSAESEKIEEALEATRMRIAALENARARQQKGERAE